MSRFALYVFGLMLFVRCPVIAQDPSQDSNSAITTCTFDDDKEISIRYTPVKVGEKLVNGKPWSPGGSPMILFAQAETVINNASIPLGAYKLYVIPNKNNWLLVINKNVAAGAAYDESQDVVRAPMESGQLSEPTKELDLAFAHIAAKVCNLRLYYGKAGSFAEFKEK
jgi:DUF2911 family protein